MLNATIGFRAHSGWAVAVAVAGGRAVERRRIELCDRLVPGSAQPYHTVVKRPLPDARKFIRRCAEISTAMAEQALRQLSEELAARSLPAARCVILTGSGRPLGELAKTLASHPMIHTAEGEFYRGVIAEACRRCTIPVYGVAERELCSRLEEGAELRADLGRPWRRDEKLCALAASLQKAQDLRLVLNL
jgi:hypothetical protein